MDARTHAHACVPYPARPPTHTRRRGAAACTRPQPSPTPALLRTYLPRSRTHARTCPRSHTNTRVRPPPAGVAPLHAPDPSLPPLLLSSSPRTSVPTGPGGATPLAWDEGGRGGGGLGVGGLLVVVDGEPNRCVCVRRHGLPSWLSLHALGQGYGRCRPVGSQHKGQCACSRPMLCHGVWCAQAQVCAQCTNVQVWARHMRSGICMPFIKAFPSTKLLHVRRYGNVFRRNVQVRARMADQTGLCNPVQVGVQAAVQVCRWVCWWVCRWVALAGARCKAPCKAPAAGALGLSMLFGPTACLRALNACTCASAPCACLAMQALGIPF